MFTTLESNLGYGASYTSASCIGGERDFIKPVTLSYSQMLRMSIEESTEVMGSSQDCILKSNGIQAEDCMGSCSECRLRDREDYAVMKTGKLDYDEGARGYSSSIGASSLSVLKGASNVNVCVRQEEGFAENDYGFTCLTLGRCDSFDVPSSTSPQPVSRLTSGFTRTCKLCGTSKTPLWRSGPMGAKSLCNACGIRSNKAKKLSAANEEEEPGAAGISSWSSKCKLKSKKTELDSKMKKRKKKNDSHDELGKEEKQQKKNKKIKQQQQQQQSVLTSKQHKQAKLPRLHVNVRRMNSTTPSTGSPVKTESSSCVTSRGTPSPCSTERNPFPRFSMLFTQVPHAGLNHVGSMYHLDDCAFTKDEEQAAFLLMALSCGLVLS